MKKNIFLALLFLVLISGYKVKAYCSDSEMIRLQRLAKNITSSYSYDESTRRFTVTLTNLKKDLVIKSIDDGKDYNTDGELTFKNLFSGTHTYIIYAKNKECTETEITTKKVSLPFYNVYYESAKCKGIENYSYCSKWTDNVISYDVWKAKVNEHIEKNEEKKTTKKVTKSLLTQVYEYVEKYQIIILITFIILLISIFIVEYKKNKLA